MELTVLSQWNIVVFPGQYRENVTLPGFVNLEGSDGVLLSNLHITGTAAVKNISLVGSDLPVLSTLLNNDDEDLNQVTLNNIKATRLDIMDNEINPLISIQGEGINNQTNLNNSELRMTVDSTNQTTTPQILVDVGAILALNNVTATLQASANTASYLINDREVVTVDGGNFTLNVLTSPPKEASALFNVADDSNLDVKNNLATATVFLIQGEYTKDISYLNVGAGAGATILDSTAFLDGVSVGFLNLLNIAGNSTVSLLNIKTPFLTVPRIKKDETATVEYVAFSGAGDTVLSGSLHTKVISVDKENTPGGTYFLQPNDSTILSNKIDIGLYDPLFASSQVLETGKIITIKNIGDVPVQIEGQTPDTIFDGEPQALNTGNALTLQNDGKKWYVIGSLNGL